MAFVAMALVGLEAKAQAPAVTQTQITDPGVVINDITWATRNVGEPGKFVENSWDYGKLYTFVEAQLTCPSGWRVPTSQEFAYFRRRGEWTNAFGIYGKAFSQGSNVIFLPAADFSVADGTSVVQGSEGGYWSSSALESVTDGNKAFSFSFSEQNPSTTGLSDKQDKFSVRCVRRQ